MKKDWSFAAIFLAVLEEGVVATTYCREALPWSPTFHSLASPEKEPCCCVEVLLLGEGRSFRARILMPCFGVYHDVLLVAKGGDVGLSTGWSPTHVKERY